jgi:hypothetical protein
VITAITSLLKYKAEWFKGKKTTHVLDLVIFGVFPMGIPFPWGSLWFGKCFRGIK